MREVSGLDVEYITELTEEAKDRLESGGRAKLIKYVFGEG